MFELLKKEAILETIRDESGAQEELALYGKRWKVLITEIERCLDEYPMGIVRRQKKLTMWLGIALTYRKNGVHN